MKMARIGGLMYFLMGLGLVLGKFAMDALVLQFGFDIMWEPAIYWFPLGVAAAKAAGAKLYVTMVAISMPFLLAGLWLTVRRIRTLNFPIWSAFLTVVPYVNLLFFLVLSVVPTRPHETGARPRLFLPEPEPRPERVGSGARIWISLFGAALLTALVGLAMTFGAVHLSEVYGVALFTGLPLCLGGFAAILYGQFGSCRMLECIGVALLSVVMVGVMALLVAIEGLICIIMAAPIWIVFAIAGGAMGYLVLGYAYRASKRSMLLMLVLLPFLMGMERAATPQPELREITTEVVVFAGPEAVWEQVIAFPPIEEHRHWLFETGIAAPLRARIEGTNGVGGVRYCEFTTGPFVEPITEWNPPHRLAFDVTSGPPTMEEWTPYNDVHLHTPHLQGTLVSERGCFELEPTPDGGTVLRGTTWYRNHMWPAWYWNLQSDAIIHAIHGEVLEHIREHAEAASERP